MKQLITTETQKKIIKNRECLAYMHYHMLNGFTDRIDGEIEKIAQEMLTAIIVGTARLRQKQQETFDQHPTFAATCIRV